MHVLIITDSYPNPFRKAMGVFVSDQAEALAQAGHQVGVLALIPISWNDIKQIGMRGLGAYEQHEHGVHVSGLCYAHWPKVYSYPIWRNAHSGNTMMLRYVQTHGQPDVLHVHGFHSGKLAMRISKKYQLPVVVTEHNSRFMAHTLDAKRLRFALQFFQQADERIAVSEAFRKALESKSKVPFQVIPNAVNTEVFKPAAPSSDFIFLSAGNFTSNKNQRLQIDAFHAVCDQMPGAQLWLAGDGEQLATCKTHVQQLGIYAKVRFLGQLNREEIVKRMQQASVFLISSNHETFGVVAIEAMACGLHVIATPCGGPEDTVRLCGEIAKGEVAAYSAAMFRAFQNRLQHNPDAVRAVCEARFSYQAVARQLTELYSRVISES